MVVRRGKAIAGSSAERSERRGVWGVLGWSFYLAVSWTWVIGMVLPALMLRDYGWWSLAVFLVPNCLGAAAMGTVLSRPDSPASLRRQHARAVGRFSVVTVAFHLFVLSAIALGAAGLPVRAGQPAVLIGAVVLAVALQALQRWRLSAVVVWSASVLLGLAMLLDGSWSTPAAAGPEAHRAPPDLWLLAPMVCFGFVLCPYLDATFLHAAERCRPADRRLAFAIGFLGPFVVMIGVTVLYAGAFAVGASAGWGLVLGHMALQAGFTVGAHLDRARPTIGQRWATLALVLAALVLLWWLPDGPIQALGGKMGWEVVYRLFMAAYGLFFPAYVLYAVVPWALGMGPLPRSGRLVAAGTVATVLPMVAAGFLADQEQWLPLALGLLLAGAAVTFVQRRRHAADSGTATAATEMAADPVEAPSPPGAHADG